MPPVSAKFRRRKSFGQTPAGSQDEQVRRAEGHRQPRRVDHDGVVRGELRRRSKKRFSRARRRFVAGRRDDGRR